MAIQKETEPLATGKTTEELGEESKKRKRGELKERIIKLMPFLFPLILVAIAGLGLLIVIVFRL